MKKTSILIAVFAVIAAVSAAQAEVAIDFDGNLGPQAMHDILADSRQIIPSGALDQVPVPVPVDPVESPIPMIEPWHIDPQDQCMMVCFPGVEGYPDCCGASHNTYTWWPQPWAAPGACQPMPHNGAWYDMVYCSPAVDWGQVIAGAQGQTKSAKSARIFHPGLQQKLRDILMGYCNTYPEFAETVLPMLKKEGTKIMTHGRIVYIINGNSIIRFGGKAPAPSKWVDGNPATSWHPDVTPIPVAVPTHTVGEAVVGGFAGFTGGAATSIAGALAGAVHGFMQDVHNYADHGNTDDED